MKSKLLGYIKTAENTPAHTNEWQDFDEGYICYTLFFEDIAIDAIETYGSCGSGYTSTSWGDLLISNKNKEGFTLIKPKKDVFIEIPVRFTEKDPKEPYDAMITELLSTEGEQIAYHTGNGGCQYYSSGTANINLELFN